MPLFPGFEGKEPGTEGGALKKCLYFQYQTISKGKNSIYEQLSRVNGINDPKKYIEFFSLRNHCLMNNKPMTEIIYIHSKLMIVDDDVVIMGSANINDRSMLGCRDSEIAVIV